MKESRIYLRIVTYPNECGEAITLVQKLMS